ncbi:hypothetical protein Abr02nite_63350 [Paractinoplanes brasiliensis]|nr:hypothetical protein Abr02nite_63350 [Actinoplanes brasiliensis]
MLEGEIGVLPSPRQVTDIEGDDAGGCAGTLHSDGAGAVLRRGEHRADLAEIVTTAIAGGINAERVERRRRRFEETWQSASPAGPNTA